VKRFGNPENGSHLGEALRRECPRPSRELEELVTTYVAYRPRDRRVAPRLAAVLAVSTVVAVVLGLLVGVGQAASGPQQAVAAVVNVLSTSASSVAAAPSAVQNTSSSSAAATAPTSVSTAAVPAPSTNSTSPADDQYKPGKGCGDTNHVHARENECNKLK
jgi:hypothetical protein